MICIVYVKFGDERMILFLSKKKELQFSHFNYYVRVDGQLIGTFIDSQDCKDFVKDNCQGGQKISIVPEEVIKYR